MATALPGLQKVSIPRVHWWVMPPILPGFEGHPTWEEWIREIKKNPRPHLVAGLVGLILPTALLVLHWLLWG